MRRILTTSVATIAISLGVVFSAHALQYDSLREYFTFTGALRVVDGALYIGGGTLPTGLTVLKNIVVLTGDGFASGVASYARDILSADTASLASVVKRAGTGSLIVKTRSADLTLGSGTAGAGTVDTTGTLRITGGLAAGVSTPLPATAGTLRAAEVLSSSVSSTGSIQVSGGTNGVTITAPTLTYGGTGLVVGGRTAACFKKNARYTNTSADPIGLDDGIKGNPTINTDVVVNIAGGSGSTGGNGGHGKCQFTSGAITHTAYPVDFGITNMYTVDATGVRLDAGMDQFASTNKLVVEGVLVCCYGG